MSELSGSFTSRKRMDEWTDIDVRLLVGHALAREERGNILTTELLPPSIGTRGSLNRAVYRIKRAEAGTR